jgi:NAD(P)H-dependent flavin oxidoreductase YrpB (nitropropane dioxygenase family)
VSAEWKQAIVSANSEDVVKADVLNDITPLPGTAGFGTVLRSIRTPFLDEWSGKRDEARSNRDKLREKFLLTHQAGRQQDTLLTAGQTAGGIRDIRGIAELMRELMAETEAALAKAQKSVH